MDTSFQGLKKCSTTRSMPLHNGSRRGCIGRACAFKPDSFAHVARTPDNNKEELDDSQGRDQDLLSGRCGLRFHSSWDTMCQQFWDTLSEAV